MSGDGEAYDPAEDYGNLSVGDWETMKTRLLAAQCSTCVGRPGNKMRLNPGRLRDLVDQARKAEGYIVCHKTLPGFARPGVRPAICCWFAGQYDTQALQVLGRLFGFAEVPPWEVETMLAPRDASCYASPSTSAGPRSHSGGRYHVIMPDETAACSAALLTTELAVFAADLDPLLACRRAACRTRLSRADE